LYKTKKPNTSSEKQWTVVRSTSGAVNETLSDMAYNENKVRDGLKQLLPYVDLVVSQYKPFVYAD